jgi:hypothetical protein
LALRAFWTTVAKELAAEGVAIQTSEPIPRIKVAAIGASQVHGFTLRRRGGGAGGGAWLG